MADNVNIIVQDTINDIVVNAAVIVETIDINVQVAVDEVQIIANPNNYVVNINRIIGEQVQSDWDQADDQAPDYIKNKPTIPTATSDLTNDGEDGINPFITAADVTAQVNSDWDATSGVAEILNKPTIPTNTSDLTNDGEDGINPFITAADIPASLLVALPFTTDHLTATNNAYVIGDVVWYLGNVYRCIANNDSILPTSSAYWTNLGAGNPLVEQPSDWNSTSGNNQILNKPTIPTGTVTSVGLTMPSAFSVANSPITSSGDISVTGAGVVSQYVRGDGSLANFPTSTGGGASLSFYLNGSVSQGTIGGVAFREMDRTPILGAGTDFTIAANGYIQSFITDANVPNLLEIPAGNWNFETYFSASSNGGSPSFYLELYKWNGVTLSLIASNSANPEGITNGTAIDLYVSALAVPQTTLLATDRLAIRIYVTHSGRTIKLHTENSHLCQVITTFSTGLTALNGLTTQVQSFATGTSGTDFGISSATSTHTFNLPTASAANRGALSSTDWSTFNGKFTLPALTSGSVLFSNGTTIAQDNANLFWDDTNNRLGIGTNAPNSTFHLASSITAASAIARGGNITSTLVAAANSDVLVGLEINPTFTLGAFTSVNSVGLLVRNGKLQVLNGWTGNNPYADVASFGNPVGSVDQFISVDSLASKQAGIVFRSQLGNRWTQYREATNSNMIFLNASTGTSALSLFYSSANVGINTTTDAGFKLDVNGTARVSGNATFGTLGTGTGMFWDNTNNRLGIGTNAPSRNLELVSTSLSNLLIRNGSVNMITNETNGIGASDFRFRIWNNGNTNTLDLYGTGDYDHQSKHAFRIGGTERMRIAQTTGNVLINTTTDAGYRLDVNGTARVSLDTTLGTAATNSVLNLNGLNRSQINFQINGVTGWNLKYQSSDLFFNKSTDQFVIYDNQGSYFSNKLQVGGFVSYASSQTLRVSGSFAATTTGIIGATTQDASSQFQIDSTTKGFLPPRMTTTQKNAIATPAAGLVVYDTTLGKLCVRGAAAWETITSI